MAWTSPRTWAAGETLTAALLNTHLRDNMKTIGDPWTSYTPTLGGGTLNNGILTGKYLQAGKLVIFRARYTIGSTDTLSGGLTISLPVAAADPSIGDPVAGTAGLVDTSESSLRAWQILIHDTGGTAVRFRDATGNGLNPTTPYTWAAEDIISISGTYEAA